MKVFISLLLIAFLYVNLAQKYKVLTGAMLMTRGLDFFQGGLVPQEQLRSPIFDYSFAPDEKPWSPTGRPSLQWSVPKECTLTPTNSHVEQSSSDIFNSYAHTVTTDISGFNFGISINIGGFGIGGSYGQEYGRIRDRLRTEFKSTNRGLYYTSSYSVTGLPYMFMPLNSIFKMLVERLPATPKTPQELEMYKVFLEYYGGFFSWHAIFGGQIRAFSFLKKVLVESRDVDWIRQQVSFSFHYSLFNISGGGFRNRSEIRVNNFFSEHSQSELVYTGGIRSLQRNDSLKEWDHSIDDEPGLLVGKFRPISDLVTNEPVKKANMAAIIKTYSETGKVLPPPAAQKIHNTPKIPGYNVIGAGYDSISLQTKLPVFDHDELGFEHPTSWTNPFYPQHSFSVPSTIKLQQRTESVEMNFTDISMTKNEFEVTYSHKETKKYFFGMGKRSREVFFYLHRFEHQMEALVSMEKQISWYDLMLQPSVYFLPQNIAKYMNPHLKVLIDGLGTDWSREEVRRQYRMIIEYWGTHLVIGTVMGGKAKSDVYFKRDILRSHIIDIVKTQSSFSFLGFLNSGNYNFRNDTRIANWFKENTHIEQRWIGGRRRPNGLAYGVASPEKGVAPKTPWQEFVESVREDPEVLQHNIVPLSTVIRDPVRSNLMNQAIEDYKKEIITAGNSYSNVERSLQ